MFSSVEYALKTQGCQVIGLLLVLKEVGF